MNKKKTYAEKLQDPRWQKKRLDILNRDNFRCTNCDDDKETLDVHHKTYHGDPWDTPNDQLITLCRTCHKEESLKRPTAEKRLLDLLRGLNFTHIDLDNISDGFEKYKHIHIEGVMSSTLGFMLSNEDFLTEMVNKYFAHLKGKRGDAF